MMVSESGEDNHVCRICMAEISDAASVKGCNHAFCYHCLHQWTSTRRSPLCPICRMAITALVLADGTEQAAQPAVGDQQSEEPDLSCLDHNYFLGEVGRLLSRANSLHNRLYTEAYGCGRKGGSRQMQRCLNIIQDVLGVLHSYRSSLQDEERFDAEVLLQDLYRLDRQLTTVQTGEAHDAADTEAEAAAGNWVEEQQHDYDYHDDDYWHEDDDDHHDEHDWHKWVSRTPGRAPTSRHVMRDTRNSNSSLQQAQQQRRQQRQQPLPRGRGRG